MRPLNRCGNGVPPSGSIMCRPTHGGLSMAALAPYVVLDLTIQEGWLCGRMLADLGAEVIKVEPVGGDPGRHHGTFAHEASPDPEANLGWWFHNRGKSSVTLDLDTEHGRSELLRLVASADVLIESFHPGWLEARDLGPDTLLAANPGLIVTSITPFGRTGPYANWSASDLIVAATCGEMWLTGDPDRAPLRLSVPQFICTPAAEAAANTTRRAVARSAHRGRAARRRVGSTVPA